MNVYEKLSLIQSELKAPKNQYNKFGGYWYRSAEDILEALKPLLQKYKALLTINDEVQQIGDKIYVKATASLINYENEKFTDAFVSATAYAREAETRKGMDDSQITGATSSYARKYALNGLFAIDDNKDPDATNDGNKEDKKAKQTPKTELASFEQVLSIENLYSEEEVVDLLKRASAHYGKEMKLEDLPKADAEKLIRKKKNG